MQRIPSAVLRKPPPPPHPTLPVQVAVGAVLSLLASLVASRFLLRWLGHYRWPILVYVVIAAVLGYAPSIVFAVRASRRWGSGSLRDDTGFHLRKVDAGWGPVTWASCFLAQIVLGILVLATRIPITSNTEGIGELSADRGYVISLLVVAVLVAPIVEEMIFRGLVLRGLLSRMGAVPAVFIQALLFGSAHVDPVRGMGNIGLVIVLSGVGGVLGGAEYLFRRLGPTMLAHGILNAVALTIVLIVS